MENTSNLHGLLNLPDQIRSYGPLRIWWEGGYKGEGILRSIKPLISHGVYDKKFAENVLTNYYKQRFFSHALSDDLMKDTQGDNNQAYQRFTEFKTYNSILEVKLEIQVGGPVSLILFQDGDLGVSCMEEKEHIILKVFIDDDNGYNDHETWVASVKNTYSEYAKFEKKTIT